MTDFTVSIKDQVLLDGLAYARAQYNASHGPEDQYAEDASYFAFIATSILSNYAQQKAEADIKAVADVMRSDPAVLAKAKAAVQADIDAKAAQAVDVAAVKG